MILTTLFETRYLPHARRRLKPKTAGEYERLIRKEILPRLGGRDVASLALDDIETLHEAVPGAVQANRAVSYLLAVVSFAVERKIIPEPPFRMPTRWRNPERGREFFYTPEQTTAILAAARAWDDIRARYIELELLTGVRPNELRDSGPSWRHGAALQLPDSKTGVGTVYLSERACAILDGLEPVWRVVEEWPVPREPVFRLCYFPSAGMDLRRAWVRICRDAGVPRARLYDLRHTYASAALAAGYNLDTVGLLLRHKKPQTTRRYTHLSPDVAVKAAEAAAERMGA